jgi:hypothetical protein
LLEKAYLPEWFETRPWHVIKLPLTDTH